MFYLVNGTVAGAALTTINASLNIPINEDELVDIFKTGQFQNKWTAHVSIFYNEVPVDVLKAFVIENHISKSNFFAVHLSLPGFFKHPSFVELMRLVYG